MIRFIRVIPTSVAAKLQSVFTRDDCIIKLGGLAARPYYQQDKTIAAESIDSQACAELCLYISDRSKSTNSWILNVIYEDSLSCGLTLLKFLTKTMTADGIPVVPFKIDDLDESSTDTNLATTKRLDQALRELQLSGITG